MFICMFNLLFLKFRYIFSNKLCNILYFIENIDCFALQNAFSNDNCRKIDNIEIYTKIEAFRDYERKDFCCHRMTFINCELYH